MNSNPPLIRVQGSGKVSSTPDTVIVGLGLKSEHKDYAKATADAARKLELLRAALPKAGLAADQLKTESFNIGVEYDYQAGTQTFRAYSVKHHLSLRLPFEPVELGRVLTAVMESGTKAHVTLTFTATDAEAVKRRVLEEAVHKARSRAELIARAAGQQLGAVRSIEYGSTEILVQSRPQNFYEGLASPSLDLAPADIETDDTVLMVWELAGA
jgi:uncharacterized protein YggE